MLAEIIGPDILILIAVIALLFGGSQIPKLARSVGRAQHEFKKGLEEGGHDEPAAEVVPPPQVLPTPPTEPSAAVTPPPTPIEPPPTSTN